MPIATGIDHVILAVHDLPTASATYGDTLGLHVSGGGTHPQFGTVNRIIVLNDDYIELISAPRDAQPHGWIGDLLASGMEGCAGFALSTPDPAAAAQRLRQRGLAVEGPAAGRLDSGDEFSRGWQVVRPVDPPIDGMPFLIRHDSAGAERRRLLAGRAGLAPHPLGARYVAGITVAVANLEVGLSAYALYFDLESSERGEDPMLAAATARLPLESGAVITIAAPLRADHGPIAQALRDRGAGLFALTIAVDDLAAAVRTLRGRGVGVRVDEPDDILVAAQLNHRQTHGARLGLVAAQPHRA